MRTLIYIFFGFEAVKAFPEILTNTILFHTGLTLLWFFIILDCVYMVQKWKLTFQWWRYRRSS